MEDIQKANPLDFTTLLTVDIRLGKVVLAERVPKAAKFIKLIVDFGPGSTRTVVTNLGKVFTPEDFLDKTIPFIMNLEPRPVAGIISEAMLLASGTENGDTFNLLVSQGGEPGDFVL